VENTFYETIEFNPKNAFNHRWTQICTDKKNVGGWRRLMPQTSILKRTVKVLSAFICVHLRPIAEFGLIPKEYNRVR
jgi:hypothetical protein